MFFFFNSYSTASGNDGDMPLEEELPKKNLHLLLSCQTLPTHDVGLFIFRFFIKKLMYCLLQSRLMGRANYANSSSERKSVAANGWEKKGRYDRDFLMMQFRIRRGPLLFCCIYLRVGILFVCRVIQCSFQTSSFYSRGG